METNRCPSCGALLPQTKDAYQVCTYCGTKVYLDEKVKTDKAKRKKIFFILFVILLVILAGIIAGITMNKKTQTEEVIEECNVYRINNINNVRVGDHLIFGKYEQDNNINTDDEIEWIVITNNGEQLTLESRLGLDTVRYKEVNNWLENELTKQFSDEEKKHIVDERILNAVEVERYLETDEEKMCKTTAYAISNGAHVYDESNVCWWWVETTDLTNGPSSVRTDGHIKYVDTDIEADGYVVRPTLVISKKPIENKEEVKEEKKETSQVKYVAPIIEVVDTKMNVYTTVNKESAKNGVVYEGDKFECLAYYETPGYKWYQIGANQWLGDGNDTRIRLVEGSLSSVTVNMD